MHIEIRLTAFFSHGDERRFFEGLRELDCIKDFKGVGRGLVLNVELNRLSKERVFELMALLWRYEIDLSPMRELSKKEKFSWILRPDFYWHERLCR